MSCTLWPDGDWLPCCDMHDRDYHPTSKVSRKDADKNLYECVKANGRPVMAAIMYFGVRLFGRFFYKGIRNN